MHFDLDNWCRRLHCILSDLPPDQHDALEALFGEIATALRRENKARRLVEHMSARMALKQTPLRELALCQVELSLLPSGDLSQLPKGGLKKL